jgi:transcription elongation factor GreA
VSPKDRLLTAKPNGGEKRNKECSAMGNTIYLTKEGRNKLIDELESLKVRKGQLSEEVARAREHGDLRENAEYHAAKESLTNVGRRIAELEAKLSRAKIIDRDTMEKDTVLIGATITIKDSDGDESEYTIVDIEEANPAERKISVQSPLVQGLLGHKSGEKVQVQLPAGLMEFEILSVK